MVPDEVVLPVRPAQYVIAHLHFARLWSRQLVEELEWFLKSMRGELPEPRKQIKNWSVVHITLPKAQYYSALEALTTKLGVRLV